MRHGRTKAAYDLTYRVDFAAPSYSNRHSLTINGKNENLTHADLEKVGAILFGIGHCPHAYQEHKGGFCKNIEKGNSED